MFSEEPASASECITGTDRLPGAIIGRRRGCRVGKNVLTRTQLTAGASGKEWNGATVLGPAILSPEQLDGIDRH